MSRVVITLHPVEHYALVRFANAELRTPRDQARHILRSVLQQQGLHEEVKGQSGPLKINLGNHYEE